MSTLAVAERRRDLSDVICSRPISSCSSASLSLLILFFFLFPTGTNCCFVPKSDSNENPTTASFLLAMTTSQNHPITIFVSAPFIHSYLPPLRSSPMTGPTKLACYPFNVLLLIAVDDRSLVAPHLPVHVAAEPGRPIVEAEHVEAGFRGGGNLRIGLGIGRGERRLISVLVPEGSRSIGGSSMLHWSAEPPDGSTELTPPALGSSVATGPAEEMASTGGGGFGAMGPAEEMASTGGGVLGAMGPAEDTASTGGGGLGAMGPAEDTASGGSGSGASSDTPVSTGPSPCIIVCHLAR